MCLYKLTGCTFFRPTDLDRAQRLGHKDCNWKLEGKATNAEVKR